MIRFASALLSILLLLSGTATAQKDPDVGAVAMSNKKLLLDNLARSPIHTRLTDAIVAAGLTGALNGTGPFTVFAPTDDAFAKLPTGTLTNLLKPENKDALARLVSYHVVPGKWTTKKLGKRLKRGKGSATLTTLAGGTLLVKREGTIVTLTDAKGSSAVVTTADVYGKNGDMHVIDTVLMPN